MNNIILNGQIRAIISALGGVVATLGIADQGTFEAVAGAVMVIAVQVWSWLEKRKAK